MTSCASETRWRTFTQHAAIADAVQRDTPGEAQVAHAGFLVRERRHLGTVTEHDGKIVKLAFSPDGQRCASASWDGKVGVWDVARRRLIKLLRGASGELYSVAFSPDGRTLVASGSDNTIRL